MAEVMMVESAAQAGAIVADHIVAQVQKAPRFTLGVATGSTPLPVYNALAERVANGADLSHLRAFALDEYVGLPHGHPASYFTVVHETVTLPLRLDPQRVHVPDGSLAQIETAGERFEVLLASNGGVDLQLLGIGSSGHLAFNEPGSSFASRTRVKTLTKHTRHDNARFFDSIDDVPMHCVTQGIGTVLEARHLVLLAFGAHKAAVLAQAVEGPLTASLPASAIQLHPHCTVIVDAAAASELVHRDYYAWAQEHKPAWQEL
jgi:glucosamine-6-phosphate deaminase